MVVNFADLAVVAVVDAAQFIVGIVLRPALLFDFRGEGELDSAVLSTPTRKKIQD